MKKESITRTKEQEKQIVEFIKSHGFKNISQFSEAVKMDRQNVWARIKGKTDPDIRKMMVWSKALECKIDDLIALFYPAEWADYIS